jgi:uncharacterized protein YlxP (DUF503 family)
MSATIGVMRLSLIFEETFSLKEKRSEVSSLTQRLRNQFNAAVAEIEDLDDMRSATIGVAVISNSSTLCERMMATIADRAEGLLEISILADISTELIAV